MPRRSPHKSSSKTRGSKPPKPPKAVGERKSARSYRLAASKIAAARRVLGAPSDTAAIEMALDLVTFRAELTSGTRAMRGARVDRFDDD